MESSPFHLVALRSNVHHLRGGLGKLDRARRRVRAVRSEKGEGGRCLALLNEWVAGYLSTFCVDFDGNWPEQSDSFGR